MECVLFFIQIFLAHSSMLIFCLCVLVNRMKAVLFTLIRAFDFDLAVPGEDIGIQHNLVRRPILKTETDRKKRDQMPLVVRPVEH